MELGQRYCLGHGSRCCRGENIYAEAAELAALGLRAPGDLCFPEGACPLLRGGSCTKYPARPAECVMYPLDLRMSPDGGGIWWVVWRDCPATRDMGFKFERAAELLEAGLIARLPADYPDRYVAHHAQGEPEKYRSMRYSWIRPLNREVTGIGNAPAQP